MAGEAPPPGVNPEVWNQLGPEAKAATVQRLQAAAATPPPVQPAPAIGPPSLAQAQAAAPKSALEATQRAMTEEQWQQVEAKMPQAPFGGVDSPGIADYNKRQENVAAVAAGKPPPNPDTPALATAYPDAVAAVTGQSPAALQTWGAPPAGAGTPEFVKAPPPPKPVTVPAHAQSLFDPTDVKGLVGVQDPKTGELTGGAYGKQKEAVEGRKAAVGEVGEAQAAGFEQRALGIEGTGRHLGRADEEVRKLEAEREKVLQGYRDKMDEYSKKLYKVEEPTITVVDPATGKSKTVPNPRAGESKVEIDPQRGWKNLDAFDKVRYTLAGALFGFLQGMGKINGNPAFEKIAALNAADVDAQKHDFEMAKGRGVDLNSHYAQAYKETGDKLEATKLALGYGLESAKAEVERLAAKSESKLAPAAAKQAQAELSEHQAQIGVAQQTDKMKTSKWVPAATYTPGGGGGALSKEQQKDVFRAPDGNLYAARNTESRKKLAAQAALWQDIDSASAAYKAEHAKLSATDLAAAKAGWTTEQMQRAMSEYQRLNTQVREAENMGVYNKGEGEVSAKRLPPPDQVSGNAAQATDMFNAQNKQRFQAAMRAEDPLPVTAGAQPAFTGGTYKAPPTTVPGFKPAGAK